MGNIGTIGTIGIKKTCASHAAKFFYGALVSAQLSGCGSTAINMECREIQTRIDYEHLTPDQLHFALMELRDCERRLLQAERKDSTLIENLENRLTPEESLSPGDSARIP